MIRIMVDNSWLLDLCQRLVYDPKEEAFHLRFFVDRADKKLRSRNSESFEQLGKLRAIAVLKALAPSCSPACPFNVDSGEVRGFADAEDVQREGRLMAHLPRHRSGAQARAPWDGRAQ